MSNIGITSDEAGELTRKALQQPGMADLRDAFTEQALAELKHAHNCLTLTIATLEAAHSGTADAEAWSPLQTVGYLLQLDRHMRTVGELSEEMGRAMVDAIQGDA